MLLIGLEHLTSVADKQFLSAKMVLNGNGAIFLPISRQHRDCKAEGISYEDNYKGNALAAMLAPGKIEIRYHAAYSDAQVCDIIRQLLRLPELAFMADWTVTYQGRTLALGAAKGRETG